ncbi:5'-methylthioadenosine/S-adenosylhomocysteine nucleosidase [Amycolatopsis sp. TRM77291]
MTRTPEPTIVVLTALDVEYAAVRALLRDPELKPHPAGTLFEVGRTPDGQGMLALARTGQGNQAGAILTERAIATFAPLALLFVGVAGALHDDLEPGDVVVATKVYGYHSGKEEDGGFLARPQAWEASYGLEELARHVARVGSWPSLTPHSPDRLSPQVHFKPVAAGEVVLNSRTTSLAAQLHTTYNDAAAIEMESAGVAKAGHLNHNIPLLAIRGISDKADGNKNAADQAGGQPIASANAAAFALALVPEILKTRQHV